MENNEKIEVLSEVNAVPIRKNSFRDENLRTVRTSEVVSEPVEMIAVDSHGKVDAISLDYNDYRNDLIKIYQTTSVENSIISTFVVDHSVCNHSITIREVNGVTSEKRSNSFQYHMSFVDSFLIPMVDDYRKNNVIFDSTIEILEEDKANFIARTKSNDSLIIIGISVELANQMKDLVSNPNLLSSSINLSKTNEKGIGNSFAIVIAIVGMMIAVVGIIIVIVVFGK